MTDQQFQNVSAIFKDSNAYQTGSKQYKQLIEQRNIPATIAVVSAIQSTLAARSINPFSKLLAVRLLKESLGTCSYCLIKLTETELLPLMVDIAMYRKESQADDRGKTMFAGQAGNSKEAADYEQYGHSLLKLVLETIESLANWLPLSPYQYYEFPSTFVCVYSQLKSKGVTFPHSYAYYNQTTKQKFLSRYCQQNSQAHRDHQVQSFIPSLLRLLPQPLSQHRFSQPVIISNRLAGTGDSNFIQQYVHLLGRLFMPEVSHFQKIYLTRIVNELFSKGQRELMLEVRNTFVRKFVQVVFGVEFENGRHLELRFETQEGKEVRRGCYEVLRMWERVLTRYGGITVGETGKFFEGVPMPDRFGSFNAEEFQQEFSKNLEAHKIMNQGKSQIPQMQPEDIKKLQKDLQFFRQVIKDKTPYIQPLLLKQFQSPKKSQPQFHSFHTPQKLQFFQSPDSSRYGSHPPTTNKPEVKQTVYYDQGVKNFPSEQSERSKSGVKRVEIPAVEVNVLGEVNMANFQKKKRVLNTGEEINQKQMVSEGSVIERLKRPETPAEEESVIIEPNSQPLEQSFHQDKQTANIMINKVRQNRAPSFQAVTRATDFMLPTKYPTQTIRFRSDSDLKALRTLQSKSNTTTDRFTELQLKSTVDEELDKMSKMYSERIKQLERSLEESRNKEKNYLRVIEEQSQEIHTLRTEISMTSRKYLNMENQTLKNKLGKMANDRTQRLSSSNNLGVSIVNSMVEKPMSMTHRPEALPSAPRISRNYQVKIRKALIRNKQLLLKNQILQIGVITCKQKDLKVTLFYTVDSSVKQLHTHNLQSSPPLLCQFSGIHIPDCSPAKQQKQAIHFSLSQICPNFQLELPSVTIELKLHNNTNERFVVQLPVCLFKFVEMMSAEPAAFKREFKQLQKVVTEQVMFSRRILKDFRAVTQNFQKAVHLNPHKEQLFYEGKKNMKFGYQAAYHDFMFLVKIVVTPLGTVFCEGVTLGNNPNRLLESYLTNILSILQKQKNKV